MRRVNFDLGEDKYIRIRIHSIGDEEFFIHSANFVLTDKKTKKEVASGECRIDGHVIGSKISLDKIGDYILEVKYRIADELLIEKAEVAVR